MANTLIGPIRDQAVEVQSKQLLNLIKRSKLSLDECTEVTVELQSMGDTFPASTVQELVLAVGLRAVGTSTSELGVQDKMQDFGNLVMYIQHQEWFNLRSDIPEFRVMELLCEVIRILGGHWLTEQSFRKILALYLMLTAGKEKALNIHADEKVRTDYQQQTRFKTNRLQTNSVPNIENASCSTPRFDNDCQTN